MSASRQASASPEKVHARDLLPPVGQGLPWVSSATNPSAYARFSREGRNPRRLPPSLKNAFENNDPAMTKAPPCALCRCRRPGGWRTVVVVVVRVVVVVVVVVAVLGVVVVVLLSAVSSFSWVSLLPSLLSRWSFPWSLSSSLLVVLFCRGHRRRPTRERQGQPRRQRHRPVSHNRPLQWTVVAG